MKLPSLSLTSKIVLIVALMGMACAMITGYATWHMQRTESQYRALLKLQANATQRIGLLRQHIGTSASLVHGALTTHDEDQTLQALEQLGQRESMLRSDLAQLQTMLPEQHAVTEQLLEHIAPFFAAGYRAIQSRLQWRTDRALLVLDAQFTPALDALSQSVIALGRDAQQEFDAHADHLSAATRKTATHTILAAWLSIWLLAAAAAWLALRQISRPIERLTASMQRLQQRDYAHAIPHQGRKDEVGAIARALKSFAHSLQAAERLGEKLEHHKHTELLMQQWQRLSSALPGAVFQIQLHPDQRLQLRFVSPQWAQLMGLPADADTSLNAAIARIFTHAPSLTAIAEKHYRESARTLQPVDFVLSMDMLDGVTRWIQTRANPHLENDGSITFNGIWQDVSKEMLQSRALEKAKRQAEQSAMERSFLQASISHEIRTPLNAILGMTQLLLKADLPAAQREQLNHVFRAGQHLRGIVNEVLDFSKIDAGQLQLESTDFSLENVVLDVLSMCHEAASQKGLSLHYKMAREVPDGLRGDPHRIAQILLNYVNNAIKFTPQGDIHIGLRLAPHSTLHRVVLHVSVQDTGPGIPADRIPLLFEPFRQADNSITRRFGGTGLGLTISRALAQLMGGSAGVDSTLGQGSNFWFTAVLEPARTPVHRDPGHAPCDPVQPTPPRHWQDLRILVVDDNPLNRAVAEGMLHALGLQVETAEDGAQALHKLQTVGPHYYACVLMDIQMPHMDGLSATRAVRALPAFGDLPIIAMTAHTAVHDLERAQAAGMNAHLSKPLLESALHQLLQTWLGHAPDASTAPSAEVSASPPVFDPSALDALAQLFRGEKLLQLVQQFTHDSAARANRLPKLAQQHDWSSMRAEAHKLTGTAATFGLMALGHWSAALSSALREDNTEQVSALAQQVAQSAADGVAQLQAYYQTLSTTA